MFRGLIEKIGSEEALAMVLAHELGHYVHRDHLRALGRGLVMMAIGMMLGGNGNAPDLVMPSIGILGFKLSREQEQTADYFAIDAVFKAYGHAGGAPALFDILEEQERAHFSLPLFSTHPDTRQRKADMQDIIELRRYPQGPAAPLPGDGRLPFSEEREEEKAGSLVPPAQAPVEPI